MGWGARILLGLLCVLGLGGAVAASPAPAALIGDSTLSYSAERTVETGGKTYIGKVFAAPGRQRHEQVWAGLHLVAILRADRQVAWVILRDLHVYAELPFPDAVMDLADRGVLGPPIGKAEIAGAKTEEFRLEHDGEDGSALDGWLWMTRDGIVMRLDGNYRSPITVPFSASYRLGDLHIGPQDPALFELPKGLARLPPEAIQPLLELRGRG